MAEALPKEQFLNRVLDSITDPLVIYDRDYRIVAVNQALATTYQVDIEHTIGRYCYEVFHGRSRVCEACHIGDVFRTVRGIPMDENNTMGNENGSYYMMKMDIDQP
jgi:transcriptional regulator with PAS, ATPase and Fis domain